jgi:hypothetical protein
LDNTATHLMSASTGSIFSLDRCSAMTDQRLLSTKYSDHDMAIRSATQSTASIGTMHAICRADESRRQNHLILRHDQLLVTARTAAGMNMSIE